MGNEVSMSASSQTSSSLSRALKGGDPLMVAQIWLEAAAYPNPKDAQAAVAALRREGFEEQEISVIYTDAGDIVNLVHS
jgi:predicted N-acetyltransferase YhbS